MRSTKRKAYRKDCVNTHQHVDAKQVWHRQDMLLAPNFTGPLFILTYAFAVVKLFTS